MHFKTKHILLLALIQLFVHFSLSAREICIRFTDSDTKVNVSNAEIRIHLTANRHLDMLQTDSTGSIHFELSDTITGAICISAIHPNYVTKQYCLAIDKVNSNHRLSMHQKSNFTFEIATIDSIWIDKRIQRVLREFNLQPGDYKIIEEPPGIVRGIYFTTGDNAGIAFFISRKVCAKDCPQLKKQKITGVFVVDSSCKYSYYFGNGKPWFGVPWHECD